MREAGTAGAAPRLLRGLLVAAAILGLVSLAAHWWGQGDVATAAGVLGGLVLLPVALALYPTGRPAPGLGWVPVGFLGAAGLIATGYPSVYAGVVAFASYVALIGVVWWRFERAPDRERRAILWLLLGAVPGTLAVLLAGFVVDDSAALVVLAPALVVLVVCLAVGLVNPEVHDVRAVTSTVVLHLVGIGVVVAVFGTVLAGIELAVGHRPVLAYGTLGLLAGVCAAAYGPFVRMLSGLVDRLLFGERSAPIDAASRVGAQLGDDPVPALRALRETLALPYAALIDGAGQVVASSGQVCAVHRHWLVAEDPALGRLEVGLRRGELVLATRDVAVLQVLAPALAQLMHARRLAAELARSRASVVEAVEEERRRLRRELHDGLGPRLTGVAYTADAVRNIVGSAPVRAAEMLVALRAEAGEAIVEVRRLVDGLRPPSLDQVGLVQSVRQLVQHAHAADGRALCVSVEEVTPLEALSAAVEVTAYRIVAEALTNVARHSNADQAEVALCRLADELCICVTDNGSSGSWVPGLGLTSMAERAEMLGGSVQAGPTPVGGRVEALLPLG